MHRRAHGNRNCLQFGTATVTEDLLQQELTLNIKVGLGSRVEVTLKVKPTPKRTAPKHSTASIAAEPKPARHESKKAKT